MTQKHIDNLTYAILGCAIEVHRALGPGLLESVYQKCMIHLLVEKGFHVTSQQRVPLVFHGLTIESELRYDILVNDCIIIELKAIEGILPIHEAQLLTYLKLLNKPKGILINFNCINIFREGQKTMVTATYSQLPEE